MLRLTSVFLTRLLFNIVKHCPQSISSLWWAACNSALVLGQPLPRRKGDEWAIILRPVMSCSFSLGNSLWGGENALATAVASSLPHLCETEDREQSLSFFFFFFQMASLFLLFLPCRLILVKLRHLTAGFLGHCTQQKTNLWLWLFCLSSQALKDRIWFSWARSQTPRKTTTCTQGRKRTWNWWDGYVC